ncbi:MAG TPA: hypothetical protein VHZ31_08900 [Solirubrobacteraceae bacterium]|nr:hypothetical protein [Solirubrobacteraceae bacterium]
MPTHRDEPWHQDKRARRPRSVPRWPRRSLLLLPAAVLALGGVVVKMDGRHAALSVGTADGPVSMVHATPPLASPSLRVPPGADTKPDEIIGARAAYVGVAAFEVTGQTTAPDGAIVRVKARFGTGVWSRFLDTPARGGRFHVLGEIPARVRGRSLHVAVRVVE